MTVQHGPVAITEEAGEIHSPQMGAISIASVTELVYRRLHAQILARMGPGQPLRLNDIAAELGVSTTPVRMAIERLAADGLVVQAGRRGASVAPLSLPDFRDIYAVRRGLEGAAARLGAALLTDAAIAQMRLQLHQLDRIARAPDPEVDTYLKVEWEMHEICYRAPGHQRLLKEVQAYRRQADRYFRLVLLENVNLLDDLEQQRAFCEACAQRDPTQAERSAQMLLDWTVERVAPLIGDLSGAARKAT
jgi:DNA-binding GntR family transcriptional regulator